MDLFARSFGGPAFSPGRRAVKAAYRLNDGMRVHYIHDVRFFGELMPDEAEMPMWKFLARYPLPETETVTPRVLTETPSARVSPVPRASGSSTGNRPRQSAGACIAAQFARNVTWRAEGVQRTTSTFSKCR